MSGQAKRAVVTRAVDFPVADMVVTVGEIEGTVQMIMTRGGWNGGCHEVLCNEFADHRTADQLQLLVDHLKSINWENRS